MPLELFTQRILDMNKPSLSGSITSEGDININLENPDETLSVRAGISQLQLKSGKQILRIEKPFTVNIGPERFSVSNLRFYGDRTDIQIEGGL